MFADVLANKAEPEVSESQEDMGSACKIWGLGFLDRERSYCWSQGWAILGAQEGKDRS